MNNRFSELQVQSTTDFQVQIVVKSRITARFFEFKVATVNVRTASDEVKLSLILRECVKANLKFVCIQEARMIDKGTSKMTVEGTVWNIMWSGGKSKLHGVAVCVRECSYIKIENYDLFSNRLMSVDLEVCGTRLKVVNAYAPTNNYAISTKEAFYRNLEKLSECKAKEKRKLAIFGDFNGYVSLFDRKCNFSGKAPDLGEYKSTESGDLFLEFCSDMKICSLASHFDHKFSQRASWYSNDKRTVRVLDHVLCHKWVRKHTRDCRIRNSIKIDSDHRALVASFSFPAFKRDRRMTKTKKKVKKREKRTFPCF